MASGVSAARECAFAVVRRVFEQDAYADRAFHAEAQARRLDGRDRSFAMALAYGTVQRKTTLDHVVAAFSQRPPERLDGPILAALRLGLMQLLLMDGVADHAAVHESVELAKRHARAGSGLVNAVLRRALREGRELLAALDDDTPAGAAVLHSAPLWLAELWWAELGADRARALLAAANAPAESAVRVNTLAAGVADVAAGLGIPVHAAPGLPEGLVLERPFDAYASPQWERGELMPQSRASMAVAHALAPAPGDRVLDLCAAPGAKTSHVAALTADEGEVVAVERHAGRADALRRTLARMHVTSATVQTADATAPRPPDDAFDRVLVDPPCSGLGTLQSRPDLRWRTSPERIADLAPQQARILAAGAAATRPGGTLVYSVCTISRAESDDVLDGFLAGHPGWEAEAPVRLAPDTDGTDGFFIARLRRP
ncbi:MAG TPA: 16S rRNA (cytosine(967)-C(5))-methyltransferase RsmB [Solirubrobacteraceae bacterium]|jgi:16S rRNA (cytosine967-C5)-methyltransferase|nr:16S rRNA (cytosine(967)-C(5))-methyltransferase RsmB [Solirubrobacteraceae bacterium]